VTRRRFRGAKRVDTPRSLFQDEAERRLSEKLYRWLFQQPEWVHVLASDRHRRRRFATYIADAVTRIPPYVSAPPLPRRQLSIRVGSGGGKPPSPTGSGQALGSTPPESAPLPDPEGDEKDRIAEAMMAEAEANDPRHEEDAR
jgi:hypothetical protein